MSLDVIFILKLVIIVIVEGFIEFILVLFIGYMILVGNLIDFKG